MVNLEAAFPHSVRPLLVDIEDRLIKAGSRIEPAIKWSEDKEDVRVGKELIKIPSRVYFNEIESSQLDDQQKAILSCIYSRHHDGFVREKHAKILLERSEAFVPAYITRLLGEYIVEIGIDILNRADTLDRSNYGNFLRQNPELVDRISQRIISYWNEYYSGPRAKKNWARLEDFPPQQVWAKMRDWAK